MPKFPDGPYEVEFDIENNHYVLRMAEAIKTPWKHYCNHAVEFPEILDTGSVGRATFEESSAIAHLFAASPTLYAACRKMLDDMRSTMTEVPVGICEAIMAMRKAVELAEIVERYDDYYDDDKEEEEEEDPEILDARNNHGQD